VNTVVLTLHFFTLRICGKHFPVRSGSLQQIVIIRNNTIRLTYCTGQAVMNTIGEYRCISIAFLYAANLRQHFPVRSGSLQQIGIIRNNTIHFTNCTGQAVMNTIDEYRCISIAFLYAANLRQHFPVRSGSLQQIEIIRNNTIRLTYCTGQAVMNTIDEYRCISIQFL